MLIIIIISCSTLLFLNNKNKQKKDFVRNELPPVVVKGIVIGIEESYFLLEIKENGEDVIKKVIPDKKMLDSDSNILTDDEKKSWISSLNINDYLTIQVDQNSITEEEINIKSMNNIH